MSYYDEARAMKPYLSALRREFHRHPCVSCQEFWTAERIEQELEALGVTDRRRVDGTGVYAVLHGAGQGDRVVLLRADTDALAIEETGGEREYRSQVPGVMHACGHDLHTAALLGAVRLLMEHRGEFGGEVRLCFQHGEEVGRGGRQFVQAGLADGAGRAFGIHTAPDLRVGTVGVTPGPNNASVDHFTVKVHGKSAHVSTPNLGADALYIASQIVVDLQAIVTRRTAPIDPVIIGVGKLNAGTAYNIVAGEAQLEGTIRAFSQETRSQVCTQLDRLCRETAELWGGSAEVEWEAFGEPLVNPPQVCREAWGVVTDLLGEGNLICDRPLSCGGDDFSVFQTRVPGVYAYVGTSSPDRPETCLPLHNSGVDFDEDALPVGAALYAEFARRYLNGEIG